MRQLRERANLRQEDVARVLEVDQGAVSKWENGVTKPLSKYRRKLAKLYGVAEDDLLSENEAAQ